MRKGIFAAAVLLLSLGFCSRPLLAQQLLWDVDFKFGFDNREYASIETEPSGTIFGAVLSPKVGLGFGEGHALYAGVDAAKGMLRLECGHRIPLADVVDIVASSLSGDPPAAGQEDGPDVTSS